MKILHIYNDYYPPIIGGIEKHINTICEGLKNDFEIRVLTANNSIFTKIENINGIDIIKTGTFGRLQSAPICPYMPLWLKKLDSDILHFHLPCPTAMISYFLTKPRRKIIVTYHSDIVRQKWAIGFYSPLLIKFLSKADIIIASSPNYIISSPFLSKFKEKCRLLPYGIDISKFYNNFQADAPVILFVGRLRYYKGISYLIEAMQYVNAKLNIIGTGPEEKKLKNLARNLNLTDKINFLGEVPEEKLPEYYANCSIFVLPSTERSEAFGIVQLEAMASEKPVVSTRLGTGVDWVNQNGITGIVVPPKNTKELADAINRLLSDNNLRKKLGENARNKVEKEFTKELMIERIAKLYNQAETSK